MVLSSLQIFHPLGKKGKIWQTRVEGIRGVRRRPGGAEGEVAGSPSLGGVSHREEHREGLFRVRLIGGGRGTLGRFALYYMIKFILVSTSAVSSSGDFSGLPFSNFYFF